MDRLLRLDEVSNLVGLRPTAIYDRIRHGEFPKQVLLGERAVAWRESEIAAWIAARPVASRCNGVQSVTDHRLNRKRGTTGLNATVEPR